MQKNNTTFFLFLLLSLFTNKLRAERTAGFCEMREEVKGKEVLALYPSVPFYCLPANAALNRIWIDVWVKTTDLYEGIRLPEKTKLYSQERKLMAKVLVAFNPLKILDEGDSLTHLVISGYLPKGCTDPNFIPEDDLSKLLDKAESNEKLGYFDSFFQKYGFQKTTESNSYESYLLSQPEFTRQVLEPRILMVFYKGEIIAIFHTRDLRVKRYDSIEMGSEYKMIYNSKFSEHTKKEMVEIYKKKLG